MVGFALISTITPIPLDSRISYTNPHPRKGLFQVYCQWVTVFAFTWTCGFICYVFTDGTSQRTVIVYVETF